MAIMLYTKGDDHEIRGVRCNLIRIQIGQMDYYLDNGYVTDPKELYVDPDLDVTEDGPETGNICKLSNAEIRQAAKDIGLENWETARFDKLKKALGYDG